MTTTSSTSNNATTMPSADQLMELVGHEDMQKLDYTTSATNTNSIESSSNMQATVATQLLEGTGAEAATVPAGSDHIAVNNVSTGICLMQSSPPPASYRHSRAYRHFKNPPQPHMCIRTTTEAGEELFINVLSWTRIVIPQEPSDPIPLYGGMRVPPGSPRSPPIVFAVMANPEVLKDSGRHSKDAEERRAMVELMCDFVEAMNPGVKLIRNAIILKDRDISGELKDVWNAVQAQRDREREEQLMQQRQQQQYVTTQQMFPKSSPASSAAAVDVDADARVATTMEINNTTTTITTTNTLTTTINTNVPIIMSTIATSTSTTSPTTTTRSITSAINLPTPTPILVGGRCGSLVGSGCDVTGTETTNSKAYEENAHAAAINETSIGEKNKGISIVPATFATSANSVASTNTATTTPTSGIIITTSQSSSSSSSSLASTNASTTITRITPVITNTIVTTTATSNHHDSRNKTTESTVLRAPSLASSLLEMEVHYENSENTRNINISNNEVVNFVGNDHVDANKTIVNNYVAIDTTTKTTNILGAENKNQQQQKQQQITANRQNNEVLEQQENQLNTDLIKTSTKLNKTLTLTSPADEVINVKMMATAKEETTDIHTAINNIKTKSTTIPDVTCIKTPNSEALTAASATTTITTSKTKCTTTTTTATTCMPTKREKLGGFLPNGCIFPRFKNSKNKDKDKEKDKEPKIKDKEKTLLNALKKNKDKKMTAQDKKLTANNHNKHQEKVSTSSHLQQQQQQQTQNMLFSEQTTSKTQYEKNCINLENEMQKLDINKIDAAKNSEKNMFIKLKCAATSAVAK